MHRVAQAVSNNKKTIVFLGRTIGRYTIYPLSFCRLLVVNSAETAFKPLPLGAENGQCTALVHDIPPARAWGCVHDLHWPSKWAIVCHSVILSDSGSSSKFTFSFDNKTIRAFQRSKLWADVNRVQIVWCFNEWLNAVLLSQKN